ncbi:MAG: hypothetical protein I8H68_05275 [Flavobacteriia bacterium]|nr:hypothetical protein [Flavobacteriia bacterium]MBH2023483.1 hypothetical protein [Flavobacteriales bacterium]
MWKITKNILPSIFLLLFCNSCNKEVQKNSNSIKADSAQIEVTDKKAPGDSKNVKKYKGAWFEIDYPSSFKAVNSLASSTSVEGYDSALFTAPDGKVQFYVFSPQWSGLPTDIELQPHETLVDSASAVQNGLEVERWTIKAKDGSYFRSYESTSETASKINKVFGIKYSSTRDLEQYRETYLMFKKSLEQFAD